MKKLLALLLLLASPAWAANEILLLAPEYTGQTVYMLVLDETGQAWNGSAFATFTSTQSTFDVAMTEVSGTGLFRGSIPGTSGQRSVIAYLQAGGSPANTDQALMLDSGYFDSTLGWKALARQATAVSIETDTDAILIDTAYMQPRVPASGTLATSADVSAVTTATSVTADRVPRQRTWFLGSEGNTARNIVTVNAWSSGTMDFAFDFSEILDQSDTTINTVSSVTVVQRDGSPTITTSSLRKHQEQKIAIFTCAAISAANAGTYDVTITITTADSNTIVVEGVLEVE
jgi:hypothetical protein